MAAAPPSRATCHRTSSRVVEKAIHAQDVLVALEPGVNLNFALQLVHNPCFLQRMLVRDGWTAKRTQRTCSCALNSTFRATSFFVPDTFSRPRYTLPARRAAGERVSAWAVGGICSRLTHQTCPDPAPCQFQSLSGSSGGPWTACSLLLRPCARQPQRRVLGAPPSRLPLGQCLPTPVRSLPPFLTCSSGRCCFNPSAGVTLARVPPRCVPSGRVCVLKSTAMGAMPLAEPWDCANTIGGAVAERSARAVVLVAGK